MEHTEAFSLIQDAAAEPAVLRSILERPDAARPDAAEDPLAGHIASCPVCGPEVRVLLRLADAIQSAPPDTATVDRLSPAVRASTLALVRASGVDRHGWAASGAADGPRDAVLHAQGTGSGARPMLRGWSRLRTWPLLAGVVAVVAVVAVAGALVTTGSLNRQLQAAQGSRDELARVTGTVDRLMQAQDHRVAILGRADGSGAGGSVIWSPGSGELVVLSEVLPAPPPGMTYRCWVAHAGTRQPVGEMHFQGGLAFWAGPLSQWGGVIEPGDQFGVSLVPAGGGPGGTTVLLGGV